MQMEVERCPFYRPEGILKEVKEKLETAAKMGKAVDYITFVPDGMKGSGKSGVRRIGSL
jgi:hypothetical protein